MLEPKGRADMVQKELAGLNGINGGRAAPGPNMAAKRKVPRTVRLMG